MATHSYTAKLQWDADGAGSYTDIAEILSISGPNIEFTDVETTHLSSANAFKEYVAGFGDGGEVKITINFAKAQINTLYGLVRVTEYWKVLFPLIGSEATNSQWAFQGHIKSLGNEIPDDDRITCDMVVKVTGKPTFTQGA